jgi:hypothetical protein
MSWRVALMWGTVIVSVLLGVLAAAYLLIQTFLLGWLNRRAAIPDLPSAGIGISFRQKYGFRETSAITWNSCPGQKITEWRVGPVIARPAQKVAPASPQAGAVSLRGPLMKLTHKFGEMTPAKRPQDPAYGRH